MKKDGSNLPDDKPSAKREFRAALTHLAPLAFAIVPFAAVFGALARKEGLSLFEIMFASATIFAGASQYAMLELMGLGIAPWVIVLTVFAVNFRHVLYSAAIGRRFALFSPVQKFFAFFFLVDPLFAAAEARRRKEGRLRPAYYLFFGATVYSIWLASNLFGALFGSLIADPAALGLDFILPLYFMGLIFAFRAARNFWPVFSVSAGASIAAWAILGPPWPITIGGFAGLFAAAAFAKPPDDAPDSAPNDAPDDTLKTGDRE